MGTDGADRAIRAALRELGSSLRQELEASALACGPFRLLRLVGEGGVAEVFAAAREGDEAIRWAVKVVKPGADGREVVARFERERAILAALDHPGIVRALESGVTADGRPWFAMPLVEGPPITVAADLARLDLDARRRLFARLLDPIAAAHAAGIVHRDLKPGNVLAEGASGEFFPRVIDFGIARSLGASGPGLTPTGHAHRLGTPDYMPPEQWELGVAACDARSDVFALGILLGELMAGALPRTHREDAAEASTARSRSRRRRKPGAVVAPSAALAALAARDRSLADEVAQRRGESDAKSLQRIIARQFDALVARATEAEPSRRFRDAAEFGRALQAEG